MNAAASSWRTCTNEILSCLFRSASMIPLMPSPGRPNTTHTPQSIRRSISTSAVVLMGLFLASLIPGGGMESTNALVQMTDQPVLDVVAEPLADAIKGAYSSAGTAGQLIKNTMHGVW